MSIIGQVEKKSFKVKFLNLAIHVILILGATTMVYPLLLMISGSLKSQVDFKNFDLLPPYLYNDEALFQKYIYTKYNGSPLAAFILFKTPTENIDLLGAPENYNPQEVKDYKEFLAEAKQKYPHYWYGIGGAYEYGVYPFSLRDYRAWLQKRFGKDLKALAAVNEEYGTEFGGWDGINLPAEAVPTRRSTTDYDKGILASVKEYKTSENLKPLNTIWFDFSLIAILRRDWGRNLSDINKATGMKYNSWSEIFVSNRVPANPKLAKTWASYVKDEANLTFIQLDPSAEPGWRQFLQNRYKTIDDMNELHGTKWASFEDIKLQLLAPKDGQLRTDWADYVAQSAPVNSIQLLTLAEKYQDFLKKKYGTIEALNKAHDITFKSFDELPLKGADPDEKNFAESELWHEFIKSRKEVDIGLSRTAAQPYKTFIESLYQVKNEKGEFITDFAEMSADYGIAIATVNDIPFHSSYPAGDKFSNKVRENYLKVLKSGKFTDSYRLINPESMQSDWVAFLKKKFNNDLTSFNKKFHLIKTDFSKINLPIKAYEWELMLENKIALRKEYMKRNYLMVFDTLFTNGNAAINTLIYCFLAVAAALLVNPLCAYGLSRFKPACSYKVLLFLMLPMAFPGMVLGIPQFLLIRDFGLLNTFAALILPGMAAGYSIFLLKGFFDSLPKELFESAAIDGASEWTVFWHIAMRLSTPILSVIALGAFTGAYANFMMAFLICQEQSMWTMMVYLYQLQQRSSQAVGFAALIIAAVPTLLVFIFCQNIIIKGIVVPTEK